MTVSSDGVLSVRPKTKAMTVHFPYSSLNFKVDDDECERILRGLDTGFNFSVETTSADAWRTGNTKKVYVRATMVTYVEVEDL